MLAEAPPIPLADGTADTLRGVVRRGAVQHKLTDIERRLLRYLHDHALQDLSRQRLHVDVWDYAPTVRSRAADHTIARLRTKIEVDPGSPALLQTVHGVGYRWVPAHATEAEGVPGDGLGQAVDLVGRADDIAALREAVGRHAQVAVVGPVGVGCSALVTHLGWRTVDLADVATVADAVERVATALGVPSRVGLRPADLAAAVGRQPVVLDDAGVDLGPLLSAWSGARVVVTSRRRQGGVGHTLVLRPLEPAHAVQLLQARVAAAGPGPGWDDPPALEAVAARADGLPLALHVLGAQATWLDPTQLLEQLDAAPGRVLQGEGMLHAVAGAVQALAAEERVLLERLAVFDAAPLAAAHTLGEVSALRALMERSLLWPVHRPGEVRYRVLRPVADAVRALSPDALVAAREAHAAWVCAEAFARAGHPCHDVADPTWWRSHLPELLQAVEHAPAGADRARLALALVRVASFAWLPDPRPWAQRAVEEAEAAGAVDLLAAARALRARFDPADPAGDLAAAADHPTDPRVRAMVVHHRALGAVDERRYDEAVTLATQAYDLFLACRCEQGALDTLFPLVDALHATGRGAEAEAASTRAIRLARRLDDARGLGIAYATRGYAAESFGATLADQQRALDVLESVHDINAAVRIRLGRARLQAMGGFPCEPLGPLVDWADALGQPRLAERARLEAAAAALHLGQPEAMAAWLEGLEHAAERDGFGMLFGCLHVARGDQELGYQLLRAAALDDGTAHPTTGFFYAVAALVGDDRDRWAPAVDRFASLVEGTGRFSPFMRFRGLYRRYVGAFRAAMARAEGDDPGLAWAEVEAVADEPLPIWTDEVMAWRALVAGERPAPVRDHPAAWVLRAMATR